MKTLFDKIFFSFLFSLYFFIGNISAAQVPQTPGILDIEKVLSQITLSPQARDKVNKVYRFFLEGKRGEFLGENKVKLSYIYFPSKNADSKKAFVFVNGRTESYIRYAETMYDFSNTGHAIYNYDHRGQGFSQRIVSVDSNNNNVESSIGHIDDFKNYVFDLKIFLQQVVATNGHNEIVLVAHSMGGLIASYYLAFENDLLKEDTGIVVKGAILSAPFLGAYTKNLDQVSSFAYSAIEFPFLGDFVISKMEPQIAKPYVPTNGNTEEFKERVKNYETASVERASIDLKLREVLYPETCMGKYTGKWVKETKVAQSAIFSQEWSHTHNLPPLLILQASLDETVDNQKQNEYMELYQENLKGDNNKRARTYKINGAQHNIFLESDNYRNQAKLQINLFLNEIGF